MVTYWFSNFVYFHCWNYAGVADHKFTNTHWERLWFQNINRDKPLSWNVSRLFGDDNPWPAYSSVYIEVAFYYQLVGYEWLGKSSRSLLLLLDHNNHCFPWSIETCWQPFGHVRLFLGSLSSEPKLGSKVYCFTKMVAWRDSFLEKSRNKYFFDEPAISSFN